MQLSLQLFKRFSKFAWFLGKKGSGLQANKLLSKKDIPNKYGHKPGLVDILCKKLSLMFWCLFFFNQLWTSWTLQTSNHQSKQHKLSQNDWTQTLPIKSSPRSAVGPGRKNIYKWMWVYIKCLLHVNTKPSASMPLCTYQCVRMYLTATVRGIRMQPVYVCKNVVLPCPKQSTSHVCACGLPECWHATAATKDPGGGWDGGSLAVNCFSILSISVVSSMFFLIFTPRNSGEDGMTCAFFSVLDGVKTH